MAWVQWATWPDLVAWAQWATVVAAVDRPVELYVRCPQRITKGTDAKRDVPLRTADTTTLDLGRGPEFCESARPTSVGNTVSGGVRHALAQCFIGHKSSNRVREVFDVMRPGDQTVCLVRH